MRSAPSSEGGCRPARGWLEYLTISNLSRPRARAEGLMATVAVTDFTFPSLDVEEAILRPTGATLVHGQCKTVETLVPLVSQADAILTQFAPVKADAIA